MASRVLVVEDQEDMRVILRDNLEFEGYEVLLAGTGEQGASLAFSDRPDLVLLDVMLPGMSGYEVCRKIRGAGLAVPIVMLSARNADIDRVTGLEFGADDYVGKPFNVREVLARIKARLRHFDPPDATASTLAFGDITIETTRRTVLRRSRPLDLSAREYDLLWYLVTHAGVLIPREQLLSEVWGYSNGPSTRTVDNFIAKLRRKIESNAQRPRHILTVHGTGYRFVL